jgi:uncharacterized protein (TIGR00255 family)
MKSMTGFGQASAQVEGVTIEVSVRAVNGRFLDIRPHLPKKFAAFESEMSKLVKKQFVRGTCDIYVQRIVGAEQVEVQFHFQKKIAKKWLEEFRRVLKDLKMPDTITARDLISIPDFAQVSEVSVVGDKEKAKFLEAVKKAVEACRAEREREGESLRKVCLQHLSDLKVRLKTFKALRAEFMAEAPGKLREKLEKILQGAQVVEPARLLQEVAILADRSDIEEELNRLAEHIKNIEQLVASPESQGKKLDFYAQELLREVNTIGSKSSSAKIVETVVSAKNLIEQFREQVQNIE